jgi:hypothetical protein
MSAQQNIIRVEHNKDNPYVVMNKTGLNDPRLSFKAKGILSYLLSKPDDWQVYVSHLATQAADGKGAVRSGIKELIKYGYAKFERHQDKRGRFTHSTYTIYEVPHTGLPHVENPDVDNPNEENPPLLSNDSLPCNDVTDAPPTAGDETPPPAPPPTKKKPKAKKERKPVPEAVKTFRANAHRYPAKAWYDDVDQTVGTEEADLSFWGEVVKSWVGYGWNPTNVKGMLECYKERRLPVLNGGRTNGRTQPVEQVELATGLGPPLTEEYAASIGLLDD